MIITIYYVYLILKSIHEINDDSSCNSQAWWMAVWWLGIHTYVCIVHSFCVVSNCIQFPCARVTCFGLFRAKAFITRLMGLIGMYWTKQASLEFQHTLVWRQILRRVIQVEKLRYEDCCQGSTSISHISWQYYSLKTSTAVVPNQIGNLTLVLSGSRRALFGVTLVGRLQ